MVPRGVDMTYNVSMESAMHHNFMTSEIVHTILGLKAATAYNISVAACTLQSCGDAVLIHTSTYSICKLPIELILRCIHA